MVFRPRPTSPIFRAMREPFFGQNAKAWAIQMAVAIIMMFTLGPLVGQFVADNVLCKPIGVCSREAAARLNVPQPQ